MPRVATAEPDVSGLKRILKKSGVEERLGGVVFVPDSLCKDQLTVAGMSCDDGSDERGGRVYTLRQEVKAALGYQ